jgi:hypothetical protein
VSGDVVGVSGGDVGSAVTGDSRWATLRFGVDGRRLRCLFLAIGERWRRFGGVDGADPVLCRLVCFYGRIDRRWTACGDRSLLKYRTRYFDPTIR